MTSYCQLTKLYATPYDKIIYFYVVIWQNTVMKSLIINELRVFFAKHPQILPYHLAISAEVAPSTCTMQLRVSERICFHLQPTDSAPPCVALSANLGPQPRLKLPTNAKRCLAMGSALIGIIVALVMLVVFVPTD